MAEGQPMERAPAEPMGAGEVELEEWLQRSLLRINQEAQLHFHPEFLFRLWNTCMEHYHDALQLSFTYSKYRYLLLLQKAMFMHFQLGCSCVQGRHPPPLRPAGDRLPPPPPPPGLV
uniref:Vpx protein n=1 Tax=Simian immunodeficiency virus TaxID=11723 RepID=A0A0A7RWR4_SIV|nr:vpx protein [Simian immunodeficiency virus]